MADERDIKLANGGLQIAFRKRSTPRCIVDFFTAYGAYRAEAVLGQAIVPDGGVFERSPSATLLSATTSKSLASPAGTWSVTLPDRPIYRQRYHNHPTLGSGGRGHRWSDVLRADDLVVIRMQRPPYPMTTVMVGLVEGIPIRTKTATPEGVIRSISISGQDLGKLFLNAKAWYASETPGADPTGYALRNFVKLAPGHNWTGETRARLIHNVMTNLFAPLTKASYPLGDPLGSKLEASTLLGLMLGRSDDQVSLSFPYLQMEGPIWTFLRQVVEDPWFELFVDTLENDDLLHNAYHPKGIDVFEEGQTKVDGGATGNYLVMRQTPFDKEDWERLPAFEFDDLSVTGYEVGGVPSDEIANFFYAKPLFSGLDGAGHQDLVRSWAWNHTSVDRHGIRSLIKPFQGFDLKRLNLEYVQKQSDRLCRWFQGNDEFLAGQITVQGHPAYKVGCRAIHVDDDRRKWEYYLETVGHSFQAFSQYQTSLGLSRGLEVAHEGRPPFSKVGRFNDPSPKGVL